MRLDYKDVSNFEQIRDRFIDDASAILLNYDLRRESYEWQITAIELYLYHPKIWCDPATHGADSSTLEQLNSHTWYLHRTGKLARKRLGIDVTAGSKERGIHCGLLIAAIGDKDGSGRAVKAILRGSCEIDSWRYSSDEMKFLIAGIHGGNIHSNVLRLVPRKERRPENLWIGPRKNLSAKVPEYFRKIPLRLASRIWRTSPGMSRL